MDDEKSKLIDMLADAIASNPQAESLFNSLVPDEDEKEVKKTEEEKSEPDLLAMVKLGQMMSGLKEAEVDARSKLLFAIKPFLSEERQNTVDSIVRLLKIASVFKLANELDLLKDFKF